MDNRCPWCGERFADADVRAGTREYDLALEAHAQECEAFLAEQGEC